MMIYQVSFHTRHFDFTAHDTEEYKAIEALISGLRKHAAQYNLEPDWWMEGYEGVPTDEIFEIHSFEEGVAYRDAEPI